MEEALHTAPYIYMPAANDDTLDRNSVVRHRLPTGGCVCKANGRIFSLPSFYADISGGFLIASTRWRKAVMFQLPIAGIVAATIRPPRGEYLNCWSSASCCFRGEAAVAKRVTQAAATPPYTPPHPPALAAPQCSLVARRAVGV